MTKIVCSMKGCWRYKDDPDDKFDGCCYRGDDASFVCPLTKAMTNPDISELEREMIEDMVIRCLGCDDEELSHERADKILCEMLRRLGYEHIVEIFELLIKWYS